MDVLNLYSGVGGNRKNWSDVTVTAVESNPLIAEVYAELFPLDTVLVQDAHKTLIERFDEFQFIWSSPPCPSHSRARKWANGSGKTKPVYPDMTLYQEIIFLQHYHKGLWVVENVIPYYDVLIPGRQIGRHFFWSNFNITPYQSTDSDIHSGKEEDWIRSTGFDLRPYNFQQRKDQIYRNIVVPEVGEHILECARGKQSKFIQQTELWTQQ